MTVYSLLHGDRMTSEVIGRGGVSTVYSGKSGRNSPIAVKIADANHLHSNCSIKHEVGIFKQVKDLVHTAKWRYSFQSGKHLITVLDRAHSSNDPNVKPLCVGDILKLQGTKAYKLPQIVSCIRQLFECLAKLNGLLHGDINQWNIFFNPDSGKTTLIDFGNGYLYAKSPSRNPDIYAAAILMYQMYCNRPPFPWLSSDGSYINDLISKAPKNCGKDHLIALVEEDAGLSWDGRLRKIAEERKDPKSMIDNMIDLIKKIFASPKITAKDVLKHPFFDSDVQIHLKCKLVSKDLFLVASGLAIPLTGDDCIHLPKKEEGQYELQIQRAGKCIRTFHKTLKSGDQLIIPKEWLAPEEKKDEA